MTVSLDPVRLMAAALAAGSLVIATPALAQDGEIVSGESDLATLRAMIERMAERERQANDRIAQLETRIADLERARILPEPIDPGEALALRGRYVDPGNAVRTANPAFDYFLQQDDDDRSSDAASVEASAPETEEAETRRAPAPTEAVEAVTEQQQGRFGGTFGLELATGYTHFDNARISLDGFLALDSIFLGTISIDQITSDILTFEPTVRFGPSERLFFDASIPYLWRHTNFQSGGAGGSASELVEETVTDDGIGDLSVGASYRLLRETNTRPDVVFNLRGKIPTGTHPFGVELVEVPGSEGNLAVPTDLATGSGVYGLSFGASALKTLDPMVVFGSATYFYNFARDFDDIDETEGNQPGRVKVGNALQLGAGLAFALNDKSSISMSYTQRFVKRTRITPEGFDERAVVGSQANVALVNLGATFALGGRVSLVTNVGIGLTDDSPDIALSVRLPFRF